jgi:hypothetical protein
MSLICPWPRCRKPLRYEDAKKDKPYDTATGTGGAHRCPHCDQPIVLSMTIYPSKGGPRWERNQ